HRSASFFHHLLVIKWAKAVFDCLLELLENRFCQFSFRPESNEQYTFHLIVLIKRYCTKAFQFFRHDDWIIEQIVRTQIRLSISNIDWFSCFEHQTGDSFSRL